MGKTIVGILLGGILAFAWSSISWMALPFHENSLKEFANESEVKAAIEANVDERGVYLIPGDKSLSWEEKIESFKSGPFVFTSVRPGPDENYSMNVAMVRGLTANLFCALILGIMLAAAAPRLNYIGRVLFVTLGGVFAAVSAVYPNNIWWEFPVDFTNLAMIDQVVGWLLAGLAMAGLIKGK